MPAPSNIDPRARSAVAEYEQAKEARATMASNWREVEELVVPLRGSNVGSFVVRSPGQILTERVFDTTAIFANEMFAATLAAMLVNPALKWIGLRFRQRDLNKRDEFVKYLEEIRDAFLDVVNQPDSNFHSSAHEFFLDLGGYGTAAQYIREGKVDQSPVLFETRPIQSVYFRENSAGVVDTVYVLYKFTPAQAIDFYGRDAVPEVVRKEFDEGKNDATHEFLHAIRPRELYDPSKLGPRRLKYESLHIYLKDKSIIREGGFDERPVVVARLAKLSGEVEGRGPGMQALPDIRMLQRLKEVTIQGAQKAVSPPLLVPDEGVIGPVRTRPNGLTIFRQGIQRHNLPQPLVTGARPDIGEQFIQVIQASVLRAFFLDPNDLNPLEPRVAATAIVDRRDERFRRMTPLVARLQGEWLVPLFNRVLPILAKKGLIPRAPEGLPRDAIIDVKFTSPAAQAQSLTELEDMARFVAHSLPVMEMDPDAVLNIDSDKYIRRVHALTMLNTDLLRSERDVKADRKARNEARARAQQVQQEQAQAQIAERTGRALKAASEAEG